MNNCCVAVVGHVDHGKTSLVRALTHIDTDRLPEEKTRGLSITPGFAHLSCTQGVLDFVDAPGHEGFIPAMVWGASGAQAVLVVISATEGIGAQTKEHLAIAEILGIRAGVIAVTKSDLLPPEAHHGCLSRLRAELSGTLIADAPMVLCSSHSGAGLDALTEALQGLISGPPPTDGPLHSFLPIDRVFSRPGHGTVVTGTLLGRGLSAEDAVMLMPSGRRTSIRALQSRGTARRQIHVGERVAVNLRGVAQDDIQRGDVLCAKGAFAASSTIDVQLDVRPDAARPVKHMERLRVLFGTTTAVAQLRLFGARAVPPGQSGWAQLRFDRPVVGFAGQRAVVRRLTPAQTIAGVTVLDPLAQPARAGDVNRQVILQAAAGGDVGGIVAALGKADRGALYLPRLSRLTRTSQAHLKDTLHKSCIQIAPDTLVLADELAHHKSAFCAALAQRHAQRPLQYFVAPPVLDIAPTVQHHILQHLEADSTIRRAENRVALSTHNPLAHLNDAARDRMEEIITQFRQAGLHPPKARAVLQDQRDHDLRGIAVEGGRLIPLRNVALNQDLLLHADTLQDAATRLAAAYPPPVPFTTSQARLALDTTRKVIVPVLEYFDRVGLTHRSGNIRQMTGSIAVSPSSTS